MIQGEVPFNESSLGQWTLKAQLFIDGILILLEFQKGCYINSTELGFGFCIKKMHGPFIRVGFIIKFAAQAELCQFRIICKIPNLETDLFRKPFTHPSNMKRSDD